MAIKAGKPKPRLKPMTSRPVVSRPPAFGALNEGDVLEGGGSPAAGPELEGEGGGAPVPVEDGSPGATLEEDGTVACVVDVRIGSVAVGGRSDRNAALRLGAARSENSVHR